MLVFLQETKERMNIENEEEKKLDKVKSKMIIEKLEQQRAVSVLDED
jgi:hypothetical protein